MNAIRTNTVPALREALYELSVAKEVPDAETLDEVSRRYPKYRAELTEFAIGLALDALTGEAEVETALSRADPRHVSPAVSRAISHFYNRLHAARRPVSAVAEGLVENPLENLTRTQIRAFARDIGANNAFVLKLRDRAIIPETISPGFTRVAAEELSVPPELLVAHFRAERGARVSQYYKADEKPSEVSQQSFEEAVRSSGLADEQQKRLLSL